MIYILGCGGHAKVIIDLLRACNIEEELTLRDDNPEKHQQIINDVKVSGGISDLGTNFSGKAIIAIGANSIRKKIDLMFPFANWLTLIHKSATVSPYARLAPGCVVMAGAIIQSDTICGRHTIINTAASIDHDNIIGNYSHIAPGCHLTGNVSIGEETLLGAGTIVIPGVHIGHKVTAGAGSCVIRDLPDNITAFGIPATIRKNKECKNV